MRYALALEYDGRPFCGFQSQANGCGVQDAVERALTSIAGERVSIVAAGRTDAGVHALSQLVHFDTEVQRPVSAWTRGVNAALPETVAALWAQPVGQAFHARFAATGRHYSYLLLVRAQRPALLAGRAGWYHRPLDVDAMRAAARALEGTHDFSSFRAAECQAKSPVKTLRRIEVSAHGDLLRFRFSADAFLHHMVRNLVGALVLIGSGRQPAGWIGTLLAARDRRLGPPTFAPDGLYFCGADYPVEHALPPTVRELAIAPDTGPAP